MPRVLSNDNAPAEEKTITRRLRPGMKHYGRDADGNTLLFSDGEEVELTQSQSAAFDDKFLPAENQPAMRQAEGDGIEKDYKPTEADLKALSRPPLPTSHSPQDIGAKTPTPGQGDQNPGNRVGQPMGAVPHNPADADTMGHPPVRDSHLASIVGGPMPPSAVVGTRTNEGAPGGPSGADGNPSPTPATPEPPAAPTAPAAPKPPTAPAAADKKK